MTSPLITFFWFVIFVFSPEISVCLSSGESSLNERTLSVSFLFRDPEPLGDFESLTLPLKRAGNLLLLEAIIDGDTGNLIFDTGAARLVLNRTYFRKSAMNAGEMTGGITGQDGESGKVGIGRLQISALYYIDLEADIADLGHIENRRGVKILGLFGLNMLNRFEIVLDINGGALQLHRLDKSGKKLNPAAPPLSFDLKCPVRMTNHIFMVRGIIGDKSLVLCLDTGAESNVIDNHAPSKILKSISISRRASMRGVGPGSAEVLLGTLNDLQLDSHHLGPMNVIVTNLEYLAEMYGEPIDGMLGFDFFAKGIFSLNLVTRELGITFIKQNPDEKMP